MRQTTFPSLDRLNQVVVTCRRCPRLVAHRERVAREKRRAYRDWDYWGRPVPGFGDPRARLLIVGLAPGAHGSNRTGRMFTGDASGDFLYAALHRAGFASQPQARARDDGLTLRDCYITAVVRCVPPGNRPTRQELDNCRPYLHAELDLLPNVRVILALGRIAFDGCLATLAERGVPVPRPRPAFAHGAEYATADWVCQGDHLADAAVDRAPVLLASYHPSQQNTNTGRLSVEMFDAIFARVRTLLAES